MLNLGVDVDIDVKKLEMPIYFDGKNECVNCGGVNTLMFIDKFGNPHKDEIRAFDHIKCKKCGRVYSILWKQKPDSTKMYTSAVDTSNTRDFVNLLDSTIKEDGTKKFIN